MSLNSVATADGGEIGRAQALQAEACGIPAHVDMNPILLKPESDTVSQIIVHGKVFARYEAAAYFERRQDLFPFVYESYRRLAERYDMMVIEGAGSAAEVNLRDRDLVNWPVVEMADADVLLVADIDRGGVFAQVIGTLELLRPHERRRVVGVVVNRFRGDVGLFREGVAFLEQRTGLPVFGVVPFLRDLALPREDGLDEPVRRPGPPARDRVMIGVILLPRMSQGTDFGALEHEPDVELRYAAVPSDLRGMDAVIIPGTKNTLDDLRSLKDRGFEAVLTKVAREGVEVVGICGGYQMLGRQIEDPWQVESGGYETGLRLLDVVTRLYPDKVVRQVEGTSVLPALDGAPIAGYHIHLGATTRGTGAPSFLVTTPGVDAVGESWPDVDSASDGAATQDGMVWGTYIHGVFDHPTFRRSWLNRLRRRKGWEPLPLAASQAVTNRVSGELDRWADHLAAHLAVGSIFNANGR